MALLRRKLVLAVLVAFILTLLVILVLALLILLVAILVVVLVLAVVLVFIQRRANDGKAPKRIFIGYGTALGRELFGFYPELSSAALPGGAV